MRGLEICRFEIGDMDFCCGSDTPALAIRQGRRIQSLRAFRRAGKGAMGKTSELRAMCGSFRRKQQSEEPRSKQSGRRRGADEGGRRKGEIMKEGRKK